MLIYSIKHSLLMASKPTHILYLVRDTGKKDDDGKEKGMWRRIGAVFPNKSGKGSTILWDFEPVPTNGRTYIMPYAERRKNDDN